MCKPSHFLSIMNFPKCYRTGFCKVQYWPHVSSSYYSFQITPVRPSVRQYCGSVRNPHPYETEIMFCPDTFPKSAFFRYTYITLIGPFTIQSPCFVLFMEHFRVSYTSPVVFRCTLDIRYYNKRYREIYYIFVMFFKTSF